MNKRKLVKSVVAIVLLGMVGIVGAETYEHHEAAGNSATQAEPKTRRAVTRIYCHVESFTG